MKKLWYGLLSLIILPSCGEKPHEQPAETSTIKQPMVNAEEQKQPQAQPIQKEQAPMRHTTASGLMYEIIKEAPQDAPAPKKGNKVLVDYTGWLADEHGQPIKSKKFDSSIDRGQPLEFNVGVGRVIKGWDEGILDMKQGEERLLIIPANLAYGARAIPGLIPANSMLVFEVKLVKA